LRENGYVGYRLSCTGKRKGGAYDNGARSYQVRMEREKLNNV